MSNAAAVRQVRANRRMDMEVYDSLPTDLRAAMAGAVLPYAATNARDLLRNLPAPVVAKVIRDRDSKVLAEHRRRIAPGLPLCR